MRTDNKLAQNHNVVAGYFYMRLLTSKGIYTPRLNDIINMSFRYAIKPTEVFEIYDRVLSKSC